jgi:tRNA(His) 5'-end guanylyltransferase
MATETPKDSLGDRLKAQERVEAGRKADNLKPLMARLDGRAFHTFTRGLRRPYDHRFSELMQATTAFLIEQTNAVVGYTQSDEITLTWINREESLESEYLFDGKFQKITSVLAGLASAFFARNLPKYIPEKADALPHFDCRVWNVDSVDEVFDNFVWRQDDAIKNSISMAAQAMFSHRELHGVGSEAKKKMLDNAGCAWEGEPEFFKWGSFYRRHVEMIALTEEQLAKIPVQHRPDGPVPRNVVKRMNFEYIRNEQNAHDRLFS